MSEQIIYIHYGNDYYNLWGSGQITNKRNWTKPNGGLWASREDDPNGWKAWRREERFHNRKMKKYFRFMLTDNSRILTLENEEQLISLPKLKPWKPKDLSWMDTLEPNQHPTQEQLEEWLRPNWCILNYEKLVKEYDAIELVNAAAFRDSLSTWDCNCILVMNPEAVRVIGE